MIQSLRERTEAKTEKRQETLTKDLQGQTEMNDTLEGINC